jgi:hypothetical protein
MHQQAGTMLQNDINRIDALQASPGLPFIRDPKQVDELTKDISGAYKQLQKEGFYESLKEDAASKDMGLEELHYTIWGDETNKNSLKSIADLPSAKMYMEGNKPILKSISPFSALGGLAGVASDILTGGDKTPNPNYMKERKPYIKNLSSRLTKIKPDDDLILLRAQVLNNGGLEKDFNEALDAAQENGLQLSPFQQSQLQELRIPRERPIWEIFNPSAWANWIRNLTGKR